MGTFVTASLNVLRQNIALSRKYIICNASTATYECVLMEKRENGAVGLVTLNQPKTMNTLSEPLMNDLSSALEELENDTEVGAIVITGNNRSFAAGADIKHMHDKQFSPVFRSSFLSRWDKVATVKKPIIAAVNGYALGGGCELAMMADIILAGDRAKFGQPEIKLGTIPGAGGTQRLTLAIGKSRAMQLCLTGEMITAETAEKWGLVSAVYPTESLIDEAVKMAANIAHKSQMAAAMVKESVNNAYEMTLSQGLHFEKRLFHSTFATADQKEGMLAFLEKRTPKFSNS